MKKLIIAFTLIFIILLTGCDALSTAIVVEQEDAQEEVHEEEIQEADQEVHPPSLVLDEVREFTFEELVAKYNQGYATGFSDGSILTQENAQAQLKEMIDAGVLEYTAKAENIVNGPVPAQVPEVFEDVAL